ncbi:MAG: 4-hydroxy-tetrahydrodipicolinate reductase [Streptococcaceae bacterium]|jgi:4-hydroxy-tetrahydrodipicolinate reductase|nr:4-hydroxy-tetrahydrodipicolinate reductase [Streptococcaceae bacterium]
MKILLIGTGSMGKLMENELNTQHDIHSFAYSTQIPDETYDIIVDFSHPDNLPGLNNYITNHPTPIIIGTTGYTPSQEQQIKNWATAMPVMLSYNFSIGITLMNELLKQMTQTLSSTFDIELVEKHHRRKIDAPSGTANMLLSSINQELHYTLIHGRKGERLREDNEIGVHSLRAGTIDGEHEVIFAGEDEILSIKHLAYSEMVFVKGAIKAINWLITQESGLYEMKDVLFG